MRRRTLPASLLACGLLFCNGSQAFWRGDALGASREKGAIRRVDGRRETLSMSRNVAAAYVSPASPPTWHLQRSAARKSAAMRRIPLVTPSLPSFHRHCKTIRWGEATAFLSASGNEGVGEEPQKGMEDAFASLEALAPEDLEEGSRDGAPATEVKYSRTDDTPAADTGKSTEEEVSYYLEVQGELEGTAASPEDATHNGEDAEEMELMDFAFDESQAGDADEVLGDEEAEYPWTSINPILRLRGPVATGYGRGGKKLGVPTANLPASLFQSALEDMSTGVYFGWAVIEGDSSKMGRNAPVKAVVNVGYSPTFEGQENKEKIVEAHLITQSSPMEKNEMAEEEESCNDKSVSNEIESDFYDETMRLQLIGYLRPEQKFDSFPELIAQIHRDIGNADWALRSMPFVFSKEDEFVKDGTGWVGTGGGDEVASWEYESW